jgi:hypothetical protein
MVEISSANKLPEYIKLTLEAAGIDPEPPKTNSEISTTANAENIRRGLANTRNLLRPKSGRH